ncbi:MAG: sulfotransferase domain-containing protein [Thermoplasmatales archaeon]|nr:MAG: sulfotransferase domain-containing protein [Thermoplasmatales archaeon]
MKLDENINYIVSGQERSGTSMLMQILHAGSIPITFDDSRPADNHNIKGYYELEGGKIINKLISKEFPFNKFKGSFIKITAYGLKYLPPGEYKIIYTERNIEETLDSIEKMIEKKEINREETRDNINKLNNLIKNEIQGRTDIHVLFVNYNKILENPKENIVKILNFLNLPDDNLQKMIDTIDLKIYHNRRKNEQK